MKDKRTVHLIVEGAIYVAIYGLIAILTRYLLTSSDSMIYYFLPLPMAIYSAKTHIGYSITCLLASIALSFLFANYLFVLILIMPNIIIGFIFGIINSKLENKIICYIIVFVLCLIGDFLSVYCYELITGVGYFTDMIDFVSKLSNVLLGEADIDIIEKLVKIAGVAVILIDSVVKEVLLYLLFSIIVIRLKLVPNYHLTFKFKLKYHVLISLIYLAMIGLLFPLTLFTFRDGSMVAEIFLIIDLVLNFLLGIYIIYQVDMFLRIKILKNRALFIILVILSLLIFPLSIIFGLGLNFINYKISLE